TPERSLPARYNICPTDTVDTVVEEDGKRDLVPMRWGLVPWRWKKRTKDVPATFNARAETISEKPMFRDAFKRKRCLFPPSGYYEWYHAYAQAHLSSDALTKQKLTRAAEDYMKRAKEMRRERFSNS